MSKAAEELTPTERLNVFAAAHGLTLDSEPRPYFSTAKCPDGAFYAAVWTARGVLIAMSEELASRSSARRWGQRRLKEVAPDSAS